MNVESQKAEILALRERIVQLLEKNPQKAALILSQWIRKSTK